MRQKEVLSNAACDLDGKAPMNKYYGVAIFST